MPAPLRLAALPLLLAIAACSGDPPETPSTPAPTPAAPAPAAPAPDPGEPGVHPVTGPSFDLDTADLAPLDRVVQGAEVVGIGESVHGTGAQIRMRLRVLRRLIEVHGVRLVAFESPWDVIERDMAPWVARCAGDPTVAARALNPVWWDRSVPAFLQWLCRYNQSHPGAEVRVTGFDVRQPWTDVPALRAYLERVAPTSAVALVRGLDGCLGVGFADEPSFFADPTIRAYYDGAPTPEEPHQACQRGALEVTKLFDGDRARLVAATSEAEWDVARLRAVQTGAFDQTLYALSRVRTIADLAAANAARDPAMFDALTTLRRHRHAGLRTAIWAHDGHVMRRAGEVAGSQWTGVRSLGVALSDALGARYAVVGQTSLETTVTLQGKVQRLPKPRAGSFEARLAALEGDALLVVLPDVVRGDPHPLPPGTMPFGTDPFEMDPGRHFDAVIWSRRSEAMDAFATP